MEETRLVDILLRSSNSDRTKSDERRDYEIDFELREDERPSLILYKYRWIVLATYFLASSATGALQGSLSTNREIIDNLAEDMDRDISNYNSNNN